MFKLGGNPSLNDYSGIPPIHMAATIVSVEMTELLVGHDADVNAESQFGITASEVCAQAIKPNLAFKKMSGIAHQPDPKLNTLMALLKSQNG